MSIDFVIIPATKDLTEHANIIKSKLEDVVFLNSNFQIDYNFNYTINSRIDKWRKDDFDIIIITPEFIESNTIIVRFSDKGTKPKTMDFQEFIDLVSSFEFNSDEDDEEPFNKVESKEKKNEESTCSIM